MTNSVNDGLYHITGADQVRPKDFIHALRSPKFKNALIKFFMEEWKENKYSAIMKQKTVVVAHGEQCLLYTATLAGSVEHSEAHEYVCAHVEADIPSQCAVKSSTWTEYCCPFNRY